MYYIIYVSTASQPMSEAQLAEVLRASRENNDRQGITGLLIYRYTPADKSGAFIQFLEGDKVAVTKTYQRIVKDRRHHTKVVLEEGEAAERQFPDWSMGFKNVTADELAKIPGFAEISDAAFDSEEFQRRIKPAREALSFFYQAD